MKHCENCGKKINEGAMVCLNCGHAVKEEVQEVKKVKEVKNTSSAPLVLGILSIVFVCVPVVGFILGIVGICLGAKSEKRAGFVTSLVGMILSVVMAILSFMLIIFGIAFVVDEFGDDFVEELERYDVDYIFNQETKNVFAGNEFKADDDSVIYFDVDGNFTWLADPLEEDDNFYFGKYEVYNSYEALDYLEEELEEYKVEVDEVLGVISRNSSYTLDNFYIIRLKRTLARIDGEDDEEVRNAYYYGFYDEESECYDSANMNTASYVLFCKE